MSSNTEEPLTVGIFSWNAGLNFTIDKFKEINQAINSINSSSKWR
jgi:hypothetical protein